MTKINGKKFIHHALVGKDESNADKFLVGKYLGTSQKTENKVR